MQLQLLFYSCRLELLALWTEKHWAESLLITSHSLFCLQFILHQEPSAQSRTLRPHCWYKKLWKRAQDGGGGDGITSEPSHVNWLCWQREELTETSRLDELQMNMRKEVDTPKTTQTSQKKTEDKKKFLRDLDTNTQWFSCYCTWASQFCRLHRRNLEGQTLEGSQHIWILTRCLCH